MAEKTPAASSSTATSAESDSVVQMAALAALNDDITDLLGYPDPAHVKLPLGEVPADPAEAIEYAERLIAQVNLTTAGLELREQLRARLLADELTRLEVAEARHQSQAAELALAAARLELADKEREEREVAAQADQAREYTFYDEVTEESVRETLAVLSDWGRRDPEQPISLVLNSPGGSVDDGLALFDFIQHLRGRGHRVTVTVLGRAASMGAVLLQAGDERVIGRNAFLMIHGMSAGTMGLVSDMSNDVTQNKRVEKQLYDLLAERSTLTCAQIQRRSHKKDWWLSAQEAVAIGFADRVL